ncbi:hypothetical protein FHR83_007129 [Actinoplanes campanulatus]|uniref:Uncharacterized protein n=1 Tax=Actinoplanes campanulatus TaxID=113559 RepID=A0A7W5AN95_9ACTN|nr:hypothetical protein [Actinoplanes campanulatus]MBB3099423.1 hypothetical protein [Actinoplanes campanulatus]GGN40064.1 hypothetical protein GCM10010109_68630 [Actinoplanes campanulatus]GID42368.1 hypothetical protein Aca09nite_88740 [Actinoplanes campanulatus]
MTRYRVPFTSALWTWIEVEAEDEYEAVEKACDMTPPKVCAQCMGWGQGYSVDQDDWEADEDVKVEKVASA